MSNNIKVRVTIEIGEDKFVMTMDPFDSLDIGQTLGACVANNMKGIMAAYERGLGECEVFRLFFKYLNAGEWTTRLALLSDAWWDADDDESFEEFMARHIQLPPGTTPVQSQTPESAGQDP